MQIFESRRESRHSRHSAYVRLVKSTALVDRDSSLRRKGPPPASPASTHAQQQHRKRTGSGSGSVHSGAHVGVEAHGLCELEPVGAHPAQVLLVHQREAAHLVAPPPTRAWHEPGGGAAAGAGAES